MGENFNPSTQEVLTVGQSGLLRKTLSPNKNIQISEKRGIRRQTIITQSDRAQCGNHGGEDVELQTEAEEAERL